MTESNNGLKRSWWARWIFAMLTIILVGATSLYSGSRWERSFGQANAAEPIAGMSQADFEQRVHDYLLAHPEVIGEAINRLEARQRDQAARRGQVALESHADQVFHDPNDPVGGNPNGNATLVEFFDYNCPFCKRMAPVMAQAEAADPQLRIIYKEFPILGPDSVFAAKAALAANKQGKYVAFHRALYALRGHVDQNKVLAVAKEVGLDLALLKADMQAPEIRNRLEQNIKLAQALNIDGTPGFAIGNDVFTGATDLTSLQATIARARKPASKDH